MFYFFTSFAFPITPVSNGGMATETRCVSTFGEDFKLYESTKEDQIQAYTLINLHNIEMCCRNRVKNP